MPSPRLWILLVLPVLLAERLRCGHWGRLLSSEVPVNLVDVLHELVRVRPQQQVPTCTWASCWICAASSGWVASLRSV